MKFLRSSYIAIFCISLYLLMALLKLRYPGLQADEVLFVKAAMGREFWGAIKYVYHDQIPFHLIAYIGALKSWLYYPIFKLFGISTASIRIPMILLTGLSLYFLFLTTKKTFGNTIALMVTFVMALDTSLLTLTRMDIGPSAIEFFIKVVVLWCFIHFVQSKNVWWWLPIPFLICVGIFNKLNFVWFMNSFLAAAILIFWNDLFDYLKTTGLKNRIVLIGSGLAGFGGAIAYLGFMIVRYKIFGVKNDVHYFSSEFERVSYLTRTIITGEQAQFIYRDKISLLGESTFWIGLLGIFSGLYFSIKNRKEQIHLYFLFFFLNLLFTLIQQYITKESYNPWHAFTIQPFFIVCAVFGWVVVVKFLDKTIQKGLLVLFVVFIGWVRGESFLSFYNHHGKPTNPYTAPATDIIFSGNAFYDLVDYAKTNDKKMILLGWATSRQLGIFTKQPERFLAAEELYHSPPAFVRKDSLFYERYLKNSENILFVSEGNPNKKYDLGLKLTPIFLEVLKKYNLKPIVVKDITDGKDLIFRVYKIEKNE